MPKQSYIYILIAIFIIFIILCIIAFFYWNRTKQKDKSGIHDSYNADETDNNNGSENVDNAGDSDSNTGEDGEVYGDGDLHQPCPCKQGLICDRSSKSGTGICKQPPGSDCISTSACSKGYICYMGRCTEQPKTQAEKDVTNFNHEQICLNRHFLKLDDTRFIIMPKWWNLSGSIDICDSSVSGIIYLLQDGPSVKATGNSNANKIIKVSESTSSTLKPVTIDYKPNLQILRLFRFQRKIHCLDINGNIYQVSHENTDTWVWNSITAIYNKDISKMEIEDVYPAPDNGISLKSAGQIRTFNPETGIWFLEPANAQKIVYGENYKTKLTLYSDHIEVRLGINDQDTPVIVRGNYVDIAWNLDETGFYAINNKGSVFSFSPARVVDNDRYETGSTSDGLSERKGERRTGKTITTRFYNKSLHGNGDAICRTKSGVWLLSGSKCYLYK